MHTCLGVQPYDVAIFVTFHTLHIMDPTTCPSRGLSGHSWPRLGCKIRAPHPTQHLGCFCFRLKSTVGRPGGVANSMPSSWYFRAAALGSMLATHNMISFKEHILKTNMISCLAQRGSRERRLRRPKPMDFSG